jgi:hypothetical protein
MPVITVGSVDTLNGERSFFSQGSTGGNVLTISAPGNGVSVASKAGTNTFRSAQGTSQCMLSQLISLPCSVLKLLTNMFIAGPTGMYLAM